MTPNAEAGQLIYAMLEYLNSINCSGVLLGLKVRCSVLQNLNPWNGVCNGAEVIVIKMRIRVLQVKLLTKTVQEKFSSPMLQTVSG